MTDFRTEDKKSASIRFFRPKMRKIRSVEQKKALLLWSFTPFHYICIDFGVLMAVENKKLLTSFDEKQKRLIFLFKELKKENALLKQALSEKESEIARLEEQYTNLRTARMLSVNDGELNDTKQRIMKLVREVDKCIALLNE